MSRKISFFWALLAGGFLAGCAMQTFTPESAPDFQVVSQFAPFYQYGPNQAMGPSQVLRAGTRFKLLSRELGFSKVLLDDGRTGYVANEQMSIAAPLPRPSPAAATASPTPGKKGRGKPESPVYRGPAVNDIPLPDPNIPPPDLNIEPEIVPTENPGLAPSAPTKPAFRY
jgi:hypothetical protein